jgi:hypothetical protein
VTPLAPAAGRLPVHTPVGALVERPGQNMVAAGFRLPGWTGGPGFFLGDGLDFVIVKAGRNQKAPAAWRPLLVHGRWVNDEWGGGWFQATQIEFV